MIVAIALQAAAIFPLLAQLRRRPRADGREQRVAVDALPENLAVWRWSAVSNEIRATEQFRQIVGLASGVTLTADAVLARIHPDDRASFEALFADRNGGELPEFSFRVLMADDEPRWIVGRVRVWRDANGRPVRANGVIVDATERKRSEREIEHHRQQLAHLERVAILGELSNALAHELNQPLSSILSNAQAAQNFLAQDPVDLDEVRAIVADIANVDRRAAEVIRRLRDMLRRGNAQMQELDLAQVTHDVVALAHSDLVGKHVKVNLHFERALPLVYGDRVQIQQVLLNLLLNAADAMSETPEIVRMIDLEAANEADLVHLKVIDRGRGIPVEQLDDVFEPFYTTKSHGLGLGLAISRSIITAHGGRLWATNNDGVGACFHLALHTSRPDRYRVRL